MPNGFTWEGPTDEQYADLLDEYVHGKDGRIVNLVRERLGVGYMVFFRWRKRNPEKDEQFYQAYKAKAEMFADQMQEIADGPEGENSTLRQNRDKIKLEFREKWLKAFDKNWANKQQVDMNLTGVDTAVLLDALKKLPQTP